MNYRIKEICDLKGIKVKSLTDKVGISLPALYNISNGKMSPKIDTLEKIAEALDVPMWQLFVDPDKIGNNTHNLGNGFVCPNCGAELEIKKKE